MKYLKFTLIFFIYLLFSLDILAKYKLDSCANLVNQANHEKLNNVEKNTNSKNYQNLICSGNEKLKLKRYDEAFLDFKKAQQFAYTEIDRSFSVLLAVSSLRQGNRPLEAISTALDFIKSSNLNHNFKHPLLVEIAKSHLILSNHEEAITFLNEAYKVSANDEDRAEDLKLISSTYALRNDYSKAIEYELKANLTYERLGNLDQYVESGINLASYYIELSDFSSAEKTLSKFESFTRDNGGLYYEAKVLYLESKLYKMKSNISLSKQKLDEAIKIAEDIGANDLIKLFSAN